MEPALEHPMHGGKIGIAVITGEPVGEFPATSRMRSRCSTVRWRSSGVIVFRRTSFSV